jgi:hypothetical protein
MDVEPAGRDLEQGPIGRQPPLADERHATLGIERDDRHGTRVTRDLARAAGPIGPLDRVDAERQELALVEDTRVDDPFGEVDEFGPGG